MGKIYRFIVPLLCLCCLWSVNIGCNSKENKYTGGEVQIPVNTGTGDDSTAQQDDKKYKLVSVVNRVHSIDESLEKNPNQATVDMLKPYKAEIDKTMNEVIGYATTSMYRNKPESVLGNFVADVLRLGAEAATGYPVDMGLVNLGGLRTNLYEGDILRRNVYEILPFENYLNVVSLKGSVLRELMGNIASVNGAGVSNCVIQMDGNRKLVSATIGGQVIDIKKVYTVATIDYLAEGNGGMTALAQGEKTDAYSWLNIRGMTLDYIINETKEGRTIQAYIEGRIKVVD